MASSKRGLRPAGTHGEQQAKLATSLVETLHDGFLQKTQKTLNKILL